MLNLPRNSARSSLRLTLVRLLVAVGIGATLVLVVVVITGGFVLHIGSLRLSSRSWPTPLLVAVLAWVAAAALGRAALGVATSDIAPFINRHALSAAIVLTTASTGAAIGFGTYAASGSDGSGYVSQSALLAGGHLVRDEPLARQVAWPEASWSFAPLGYQPGARAGEIAPTYPPGLPAMMALTTLTAPELGPYLVVPFFAGLAVFCTYLLGLRLHSRTAGAVAAGLLATSPIFLFQSVQPMSDVPATALWALALLLAMRSSRRRLYAAGFVTGLALLTRPNLLPFAVVAALIASISSSRGVTGQTDDRPPIGRWPGRLLRFCAGAAPLLAALLFVQWRLFGNLLVSGYGTFDTLFSASNIWPNARIYAWRLVRGEASALGLTVLAVALVLTKPAAPGQRRLGPAGWFAILAVVSVLLCYLPYTVFDEWFYLRFLLPAFPFLFVFIGALVAEAADRLNRSAVGAAILVTLVAACSVNIVRAQAEQAFNLRNFEARYRLAGRYLDAMLPPNAVVFAVQESGSVRHYTNLPVVRWDQLRADLEGAFINLRALGRHPVLLVEDWESPDLRIHFPKSTAARLDWIPRADFGDTTRVRLFDPEDRTTPRAPWTDRVH